MRFARPITLALTVLTGFSGLVYEVTWQRYLATLLGCHSEATAAVLGLYLGGLALGYAWFGRLARRRLERGAGGDQLLRLYGAVELAIGLYAALFAWIFDALRALSVAIAPSGDLAAFVCDVVLCALLIGPPTVLMGATVPLLTQALPRSVEEATRIHAMVYGCNTAGAFVGALAAGFALVPWLGLPGVMRAMSGINLIAGALFLALGRREWVPPTQRAAAGTARAEPLSGYLAVAFLTGFAMMSLQTVVIRVGGLALGASPFTFSMVVATFVLGIALGSLAVARLPKISRGLLPGLLVVQVFVLLLLDRALELAPYGAHVLRSLFRDVGEGFGLFSGLVLVAGLATVGPCALLSGATLPLVFEQLGDRVDRLGSAAGRIYSWNTIGSLLGALSGGYFLLFWINLHDVYRIAVGAVAVAGAISAWIVWSGRGAAVGAAALVMLLAVLALVPAWRPEAMSAGLFRIREPTPHTFAGSQEALEHLGAHDIVFYDDDPVSTVSVRRHETENGAALTLFTNGKSDGDSVGDYPTMSLAALVPALLAEPLERAFVIGFGTGITVGQLAELEGLREVIVAEIAPAVVDAAPLFDAASFGASRHPRVSIRRTDAYRALLRSAGRFDVIISEPSNPWVSGVEMLFAREFYEAARARLSAGGAFVQWIHEYETDEAALGMVLRTFASVFDRVTIWYGNGPDLILVALGPDVPLPTYERVARRARRPDLRAGLERAGIDGVPQLLAHELWPVGVLNAARLEGPVHDLFHPLLNDAAARAFFAGQSAQLPFTGAGPLAQMAAQRALFAQYRRAASGDIGAMDEGAWAAFAGELCRHRTRECVTALARWTLDHPESAGPDRVATERRRDPSGAPFPGELVPELVRLLSPDPTGTASTPEGLLRATRLYRDFYFHAIPFRPAALRRLVQACRPPADAPGGCDSARRATQQRLAIGFPD